MKKYNCTICGAGCYSADETKTICAECEKDGNLVEVVRCKDCKHQKDCHQHVRQRVPNAERTGFEVSVTKPIHYCSHGERREK